MQNVVIFKNCPSAKCCNLKNCLITLCYNLKNSLCAKCNLKNCLGARSRNLKNSQCVQNFVISKKNVCAKFCDLKKCMCSQELSSMYKAL